MNPIDEYVEDMELYNLNKILVKDEALQQAIRDNEEEFEIMEEE